MSIDPEILKKLIFGCSDLQTEKKEFDQEKFEFEKERFKFGVDQYDQSMRLSCLEKAIGVLGKKKHLFVKDVLSVANEFYDFVFAGLDEE